MDAPELKLVFSEERIQERIGEIAAQISNDYAGSEVLVVGVLNGVFMFYADLLKKLTIPVRVDFIRLASYGSETESTGRILMTKDIETELTGKHVVVLEDIADSGLTLNWLRRHLVARGAASTRVCVLVNKLERRGVEVDLDYVCFEVQEGFLVGYGMDYDGRYRHLKEIYHLVLPDAPRGEG